MLAVLLSIACGPVSMGSFTAEDRPADTTGAGSDTAERVGGEEVEVIDGEETPGGFDVDIEPHGAGFVDSVEVTITVNNDLEIWYTLNDSLPAEDLSELYTGPFTLTGTATVRALAVNSAGQHAWDAAGFAALSPGLAEFESDLPLIVLVSERDIPETKDEGYIPFRVMAFEGDGSTSLLGTPGTTVRGALKVRGSSTASYPKHSYGLETWEPDRDDDWDVELLGLASESDWVLLAPLVFDRALMRNALAYHLSNELGAWAPHTRFIELFVAGDGDIVTEASYLGLYVLVERIKQGENRVDIAKLYPEDIEEPEVTGGYVFKRDRVGDDEDGFWAGTANGTWEFAQYLVYSDPDEDDMEPAQRDYLTGAVDSFGWALASSDGLDPTTGVHWNELIDVASWIDHHIVNTYTKNPDALRLSGYLYKDREGPLVAGPVWDFDRTMGCDEDDRAEDPTWWDASGWTGDTTPLFEHGWYRGLFDLEEFSDAYWERFREAADGPLGTDEVHATIDAWAESMNDAAERNFRRWPDYPPDGGSFAYEVAELKAWIEQRGSWIEGCLALGDPEGCLGD